MAVSHGRWVHPARPTQRAEHGDPQRDIRVRLHRHEVQHRAAIAQRVPGLQRTGREETKGNTPLSGHQAATSTQGAVISPRHGPGMACHEPERGPLPRAKLLAQRRGTHRCWGRGRDCGRQLYGTSRARSYFSGTSRNDQWPSQTTVFFPGALAALGTHPLVCKALRQCQHRHRRPSTRAPPSTNSPPPECGDLMG